MLSGGISLWTSFSTPPLPPNIYCHVYFQNSPRMAVPHPGPVRGRHPVQLDHRPPRRGRRKADSAREGAAVSFRAHRLGER